MCSLCLVTLIPTLQYRQYINILNSNSIQTLYIRNRKNIEKKDWDPKQIWNTHQLMFPHCSLVCRHQSCYWWHRRSDVLGWIWISWYRRHPPMMPMMVLLIISHYDHHDDGWRWTWGFGTFAAPVQSPAALELLMRRVRGQSFSLVLLSFGEKPWGPQHCLILAFGIIPPLHMSTFSGSGVAKGHER